MQRLAFTLALAIVPLVVNVFAAWLTRWLYERIDRALVVAM